MTQPTGNKKISYTWGGHDGTYEVNLRTDPCFSSVYTPVITGLKSCYEAQQQVYMLNGALKQWAPDLLRDGAELPGSGGHVYAKPTTAPEWYPQPKEGDAFPNYTSPGLGVLTQDETAMFMRRGIIEQPLAVFDIDRLQGELEFKLAAALRQIADAIDAGQLDAKLAGFVPSGAASYPGDTRAHVLVKLHLAAEIRKSIDAPPHHPPRNPVRLPCGDCVNGRCDMNCGPALPRTEAK